MLASSGFSPLQAADAFKPIPADELAVTSVPGVPGASAIVLFRQEIDDDDSNRMWRHERIKILTEEGKKYANVELDVSSSDGKKVNNVLGRTIQPNGTIVPFTGKPYSHVIEKSQGYKQETQVFTLPAAEVGSILEYSYEVDYTPNTVISPNWFIQGELYIKAAHYTWFPSTVPGENSRGEVHKISYLPVLPPGATVTRQLHCSKRDNSVIITDTVSPKRQCFDLSLADVVPEEDEEYMPPLSSFAYGVRFYYSAYSGPKEFWNIEGADWFKSFEGFIDVNGKLKAATLQAIAGSTSDNDKLKAIYKVVMSLENTSYTRARDKTEDKAEGLGKVKGVADVLEHKRGTSDQLTALFVGMARAAGLKAYLMLVPDRSRELFNPAWLSLNQFDAVIAIVTVDGKDMFFDPGERYCRFGHLVWQHTFVRGLRETDTGVAFADTTGDSYTDNNTARVANLTLDKEGKVSGQITVTMNGAPAVSWRQAALAGDDESLRTGLRVDLEEMLPKTLQVSVSGIEQLDDYEKPLIVKYAAEGSVGTASGKRLVIPIDIFRASATATFPQKTRATPVYFYYPRLGQDVVRLNFPAGLSAEAIPEPAKLSLPGEGSYTLNLNTTATNITTRRDFAFVSVIVPVVEYPTLQTFYSQLESKDKESIVLKWDSAVPASNH